MRLDTRRPQRLLDCPKGCQLKLLQRGRMAPVRWRALQPWASHICCAEMAKHYMTSLALQPILAKAQTA